MDVHNVHLCGEPRMAHPAMAEPADPRQQAQAEEFVLQSLRAAPEPVNPDVLFEEGRTVPLSSAILLNVIWSLVGRGLVRFTNDWRLTIPQ
jgi:hypothetical protein